LLDEIECSDQSFNLNILPTSSTNGAIFYSNISKQYPTRFRFSCKLSPIEELNEIESFEDEKNFFSNENGLFNLIYMAVIFLL